LVSTVADPSPSVFVSLGLLATIPTAYVHASFVRKTGYFLNEIDLGMYAITGLLVLGVVPGTIGLISQLLLDSFRGPTVPQFFVLNVLGGLSGILMARLGARMALISVPAARSWFTDSQAKKSSSSGLFHTVVYPVCVALLFHPLVVHLIDVVYGDTPVDFNWVLTLLTGYCAFAAFMGLWRTITRLNTGKGLWVDDHILLHAISGLAIASETAVRVFAVKGLSLDDFIGMGFCGAAALSLMTAAVAFGTMASFTASFAFVYTAIISPHAAVRAHG
jgi:hypothetical protein